MIYMYINKKNSYEHMYGFGSTTKSRSGGYCQTNDGCHEGLYCNNWACTLKKNPGERCLSSTECKKGFDCIDEICDEDDS